MITDKLVNRFFLKTELTSRQKPLCLYCQTSKLVISVSFFCDTETCTDTEYCYDILINLILIYRKLI